MGFCGGDDNLFSRRRKKKGKKETLMALLAMFCLGDECWMILAFLFVRVSSMKCCGSHVWWSGGGEYLELWREGRETGQSELMGSVIQN